QVFEGTALGGGDGRQQRVLRAHHQDGQVRTNALDARQKVEAGLVGQHHIGDDQVALARGRPAPQAGRGAGGAHVIASPAQRLVQDRADGTVIVADKNCGGHHCSSARALGSSTRKTVRLGTDSHSITPPWSPMILATSARPSPEPRSLVVTNGSKMWGIRSAGTPAPLSRTVTSSGSDRRSPERPEPKRTPGR